MVVSLRYNVPIQEVKTWRYRDVIDNFRTLTYEKEKATEQKEEGEDA